MVTKELEKKALNLNPIDKIHLVEIILESLDEPNPEIEKNWVKEAEARYASYNRGETKAIPYEISPQSSSKREYNRIYGVPSGKK